MASTTTFQSLIQILVVNPTRDIPTKSGGKFNAQDAECLLLNDDGTPAKVGVLRLPTELREGLKPGVYVGTFGLNVDFKTRLIGAVVTALREVEVTAHGAVQKGTGEVVSASKVKS